MYALGVCAVERCRLPAGLVGRQSEAAARPCGRVGSFAGAKFLRRRFPGWWEPSRADSGSVARVDRRSGVRPRRAHNLDQEYGQVRRGDLRLRQRLPQSQAAGAPHRRSRRRRNRRRSHRQRPIAAETWGVAFERQHRTASGHDRPEVRLARGRGGGDRGPAIGPAARALQGQSLDPGRSVPSWCESAGGADSDREERTGLAADLRCSSVPWLHARRSRPGSVPDQLSARRRGP